MAQESTTDASDGAAAPEAILRQKTQLAETSFAFYPDRLDYTYANAQGTRVERRIAWNVVPPASRLRRNEEPDRRVKRVLRLGIVFSILVYAALFRTHLGPLLILTAYAIGFCLLTVLLSRRLRTRHAVLPTTQGNIVILDDAQHDAVLAQVMHARRAYLRRFATIDRERSPRWNLQRLRWLFEQEVLDRDEFVQAQRSILPTVPQPLLRPAPDAGPDLAVEQHFLNDLFAFAFKGDHFIYRRRAGLGAEYRLAIRYLDVAEPTTAVQVGMPSQLVPTVIFGLLLIGFGCILETVELTQSPAFAGRDGSQLALTILVPGIAFVLLAIAGVRRFMRMVCTKLPSDILVLKNGQHDAILAELKRRRLAALKAMAEPDPLLSADEQASLLNALRERGIVTAQRIPDILARAAALQEHLGLADPERRDDAVMAGERPMTPTPPRPTIH